MVQIKAAQDEVLNDYAQNCITDVTSCLADNGWSMPEISEDMTEAEVLRVYTAIGSARLKACKPYILSCADANHFDESMVPFVDPEEWTKMSEDMKMQYFIYMEIYGRFMDTTASQITAPGIPSWQYTKRRLLSRQKPILWKLCSIPVR